jgi:hypothetical protein
LHVLAVFGKWIATVEDTESMTAEGTASMNAEDTASVVKSRMNLNLLKKDVA